MGRLQEHVALHHRHDPVHEVVRGRLIGQLTQAAAVGRQTHDQLAQSSVAAEHFFKPRAFVRGQLALDVAKDQLFVVSF